MISAIHASMARKREMLEKNEKGFTLIELLVVILIIGVLAAIAIPIFIGQQAQAQDAAAKANLANAKIAVTSALIEEPGTLPNATDATALAALKNSGWPQVGTVTLNGSTTAWCVQTTSDSGKTWAHGSAGSEAIEGTCVAGVATPA